MANEEQRKLFDQVFFTAIPSHDLSEAQTTLIVDNLTIHGAVHVPYHIREFPALGGLTHVISTHVDFPEYGSLLHASIPVVKPTWVSDSIAKRRQVTPRQYSPDPSQFFNEVILTCGTLPESDENAIIAGVLALGGQYSSPLTKIVTHIVTTDHDNEKCRIAEEKRLGIKIVLPHWFDDCLRLGKKIDERPYQFPDPQILRFQNHDPVRMNPSPFINGALTSTPEDDLNTSTPSSPSKSRKGLNAFLGMTVFLGSDLNLNKHLTKTLTNLITTGGGTAVTDLDAAEVYIGHYRDSEEFIDAFESSKIIANLSWLYSVINTNRWTNPVTKLLHYPVPRNGIPGFEDLRISVSNYSGDARTYVQNLVKDCGAQFTKTMKQDNTHLITAHKASEKCEAAQEWNINMVNHLWLEESYAKCAVQTLTDPRYTHFPSRTNLGEICGQISIDVKRVEQVFVLPKLAERHKKPLQRRLFDIAKSAPLVPSPEEDTVVPEADVVEAEDVPSPQEAPPKNTSTPRTRNDEKENRTPPTARTGERNSKKKALETLHKQADDIALFEKEMKRKGGVLHSRVRANEAAPKEPRGKKRGSDATYEVTILGSALSDGETQTTQKPAKKLKTDPADSVLPPIQYRLMVTGSDRWNGNPSKESADKIKLRQLGILLTQEATNVDILVAPKILRTRKFVVAIANAPRVVSDNFLDKLLTTGELISNPPLLVDKATEKSYAFSLAKGIERAKINNHQLFRGWEIYISDSLNGGFETYKEIITINGGVALAYRAQRRGTTLKRRIAEDPEAGQESQNQGGAEEFDHVYLVTGNSTAEQALWKQFKSQAAEQQLQPRIMKSEWILLAALTQQIRYDAKWDWSAD